MTVIHGGDVTEEPLEEWSFSVSQKYAYEFPNFYHAQRPNHRAKVTRVLGKIIKIQMKHIPRITSRRQTGY